MAAGRLDEARNRIRSMLGDEIAQGALMEKAARMEAAAVAANIATGLAGPLLARVLSRVILRRGMARDDDLTNPAGLERQGGATHLM